MSFILKLSRLACHVCTALFRLKFTHPLEPYATNETINIDNHDFFILENNISENSESVFCTENIELGTYNGVNYGVGRMIMRFPGLKN